MKFFIPAAEDAARAEEVYESIRRFVSEQVGHLTNKRIFRIQFSHNAKQHKLAVGDRFQDLAGEPVIAPQRHCQPQRTGRLMRRGARAAIVSR